MAASVVQIWNMALGHLGRSLSPIESLTDKSPEARTCGVWYDQCRQETLQALDWTFARKRQTLALHAEAAPDEWLFRYQTPADMLAFRRIWNPLGPDADAIPYALEGASDGETLTLLTNLEDVVGVYTRDVAQVLLFPPLFTATLSYALAFKVALPLTGKREIRADMGSAYQGALAQAARSDANQGMRAPERDAEYIRARA